MCHHGWAYYPTGTDMAHPHLKTDLLGRILNARLASRSFCLTSFMVYSPLIWHPQKQQTLECAVQTVQVDQISR